MAELNESEGGIYLRGSSEVDSGVTVKLFHLYLEDGSAPPLAFLPMHIPPWLWFSL